MNTSYVSEFTDFMNHFLEDHPEVAADQRRGRSIYWDHEVDLKAQEEADETTVPTPGYYYFELQPEGATPHVGQPPTH